jgi:hypothetical protein
LTYSIKVNHALPDTAGRLSKSRVAKRVWTIDRLNAPAPHPYMTIRHTRMEQRSNETRERHNVCRLGSQHQLRLDSGIVPWATSNHAQSWSCPATLVPVSLLSLTERSIQSMAGGQQMQKPISRQAPRSRICVATQALLVL